MQPSTNTGLPKHPNLTLMTSAKSSNVKGKWKKLTCWGRLRRWTWMGTATSHTPSWKRLWPRWVAPGKCKRCTLWPQISNYALEMFSTLQCSSGFPIKVNKLLLSERRENDHGRNQRYFLITWRQQRRKTELSRSKRVSLFLTFVTTYQVCGTSLWHSWFCRYRTCDIVKYHLK